MKTAASSLLKRALDLLFPPRCVHCGADGSLFCGRCEEASTPLRPTETCRSCALPSPTSTCERCFADPPALDRAISVFTYQPEIRDAISALKYRDIRSIAPRLAAMLADAMPDVARNQIDTLVPVPISPAKLRSRGYNQSELLALHLSDATGIPLITDMLYRTSENVPQARSKSVAQRMENVRGAFYASAGATGKRIMLVDDVMTTGATINACATALRTAGASWVGAITVAREL